jgi:hypothetical protein
MTHLRSALAALALSAILGGVLGAAACSSDTVGTPMHPDAGASCGATAPCGGSLSGTWSLKTQCLNIAELTVAVQQGFYCPQAAVVSSTSNVSGTVTFGSDKSFNLVENRSSNLTIDFPLSCTGGYPCSYYGAYIQQLEPSGTTFSCTGTDMCICSQDTAVTINDSGTYVLSGTDLSLNSGASSSGPMTYGYCVQDATLHLVTVDPTMSTGPGGQATIKTDIVAQRQ